jgi:hypothetical protein
MKFHDEPGNKDRRMIVFCTNVAETSLTVPGTKLVFDLGLAKEARYDPTKRITTVELTPISKSSANQRKGRAGRLSEGHCVRLFREEFLVRENIEPEILRSSLDQVILQLYRLNQDPSRFPFLTPPSSAALQCSIETLDRLGCIELSGSGSCSNLRRITPRGIQFVDLPFEPRLCAFVMKAQTEFDMAAEAADVASLISTTRSLHFIGGKDATKETKLKKQQDVARRAGEEKSDIVFAFTIYQEWLHAGDVTEKKCHSCNKSVKSQSCLPCRKKYSNEKSLNYKTLDGIYSQSRDVLKILFPKKHDDTQRRRGEEKTISADSEKMSVVVDNIDRTKIRCAYNDHRGGCSKRGKGCRYSHPGDPGYDEATPFPGHKEAKLLAAERLAATGLPEKKAGVQLTGLQALSRGPSARNRRVSLNEMIGRCLLYAFPEQFGEFLVPSSCKAGMFLHGNGLKAIVGKESAINSVNIAELAISAGVMIMRLKQFDDRVFGEMMHLVLPEWVQAEYKEVKKLSLSIVRVHAFQNIGFTVFRKINEYFKIDLNRPELSDADRKWLSFVSMSFLQDEAVLEVYCPRDRRDLVYSMFDGYKHKALQEQLSYECRPIALGLSGVEVVMKAGLLVDRIQRYESCVFRFTPPPEAIVTDSKSIINYFSRKFSWDQDRIRWAGLNGRGEAVLRVDQKNVSKQRIEQILRDPIFQGRIMLSLIFTFFFH